MTRDLILKITNNFIWYNESEGVPIKRTNLPMEHMTFSDRQDIYWKVKMDRFSKESGVLRIEVVDHNANDLPTFSNQRPKTNIECLEFLPRTNGELFIWDQLVPQLISYRPGKLTKQSMVPVRHQASETSKPVGQGSYINFGNKEPAKPKERELSLSFSVRFSDMRIILGGVQFSFFVNELSRNIDFMISNTHLLPEFDHIKFWFVKRLGLKKIPIRAVIKIRDREIVAVRATSKIIDKIDDNLIRGVKVDRTFSLKSKLGKGSVDKSLFTAEEFFASDTDKHDLGNVFGQTDKDLLEMFLENAEIRNRKELIYLSGKLHSRDEQLRFTNHPHFGFIFYVEGERECHFIWELLNSNATYIWSFDKNAGTIEQKYQRMQEILNVILATGRENYRRAYSGNIQDQDLKFNPINHKNKNSKTVDSFPLWKHRVEEVLV